MDSVLPKIRTAANYLAGGLFALVFVYHWAIIWLYAIDIPYMDDWGVFPQRDVLPWLWRLHNEHRIVTTKLLILLLWKINGWDIGFNLALNFAIYGLALAALYKLLRSGERKAPPWLIFAFLIFTLSPRSAEVHHWAMTVQFHLVLLFFFLGAGVLFQVHEGRQDTRKILLALGLLITAVYSFGGGLAAVGALLPVYLIWKVLLLRADREGRQTQILQLGLVALPLVIVLGTYFNELIHAPNAPERVSVFSGKFWKFLMMVTCNGMGLLDFGMDNYKIYGAFALILILVPWFILLLKKELTTRPDSSWGILAASLGILAILASTATGRAATGLDKALAWRYTEISMMLLPLLAWGWWRALADFRAPHLAVLAVLFLIFGVGFSKGWRFMADYQYVFNERRGDARKLSQCWAQGEACQCPALNGVDIKPEDLRQAKDLGLSFMNHVERNDWN